MEKLPFDRSPPPYPTPTEFCLPPVHSPQKTTLPFKNTYRNHPEAREHPGPPEFGPQLLARAQGGLIEVGAFRDSPGWGGGTPYTWGGGWRVENDEEQESGSDLVRCSSKTRGRKQEEEEAQEGRKGQQGAASGALQCEITGVLTCVEDSIDGDKPNELKQRSYLRAKPLMDNSVRESRRTGCGRRKTSFCVKALECDSSVQIDSVASLNEIAERDRILMQSSLHGTSTQCLTGSYAGTPDGSPFRLLPQTPRREVSLTSPGMYASVSSTPLQIRNENSDQQLTLSSLRRKSRNDFLAQLFLFGLEKEVDLLASVGITSLHDIRNIRNTKSLGLASRIEGRLAQLADKLHSMTSTQNDVQMSQDKNPTSPSFEDDPNVFSDYQKPEANKRLMASSLHQPSPNQEKEKIELKSGNSDMEDITISFKPKINLRKGEKVKLVLSGFDGDDVNNIQVTSTPIGSFVGASWSRETKELALIVNSEIPAHESVSIVIPSTYGIKKESKLQESQKENEVGQQGLRSSQTSQAMPVTPSKLPQRKLRSRVTVEQVSIQH
eukprot:748911-Hanusia_phi.AAC.3